MSAYDFRFGSHSRDHGCHPNSEQLRIWYTTVLGAAEAFAVSALGVAEAVRQTVADAFRALWTHAHMYEELERLSRTIHAKSHWAGGWIAARQTLSFDGEEMESDARNRLIALERELRPRDLVQKVRSVVLSRSHAGVDLEEYVADLDPDEEYRRAEALAERLGEEVAIDDAALRDLLPDLVTAASSDRLITFGRGLAAGATAPRATWETLVAGFGGAPEGKRTAQVLGGFLEKLATREPPLVNKLLDEAVEHPVLGVWFPWLQCALSIDQRGVERLRRSLALGLASMKTFR
jgi:hypothetical protein